MLNVIIGHDSITLIFQYNKYMIDTFDLCKNKFIEVTEEKMFFRISLTTAYIKMYLKCFRVSTHIYILL